MCGKDMNDMSNSNISYTVIKEQTELMDEINNTHPTQLVFVNKCNNCGRTPEDYDMQPQYTGYMICDDCWDNHSVGTIKCVDCYIWFDEYIVDRRTLYGKKLWACFATDENVTASKELSKSTMYCSECATRRGYDN